MSSTTPNEPTPTAGFDCFWTYAARRQQIYFKRLSGQPPPWTDDPVLAGYRFTNVYRAADRVSQYLINQVQTAGWNWPDTFARTLLFKCFNRVDTWRAIVAGLGQPDQRNLFDRRLEKILARQAAGGPIYNPAYIMPPPRSYSGPKWRRHLELVRDMVRAGLADEIQQADGLETAFPVLRRWPSVGDFLAYQWLVDLNYSAHLNFDEAEFVVAGPGARRGLRKCFRPDPNWAAADLIRWTASRQEDEFSARQLAWTSLGGRRLQLVDIQNIFCEVDKYTRLARPELAELAPGQRPKQRYRPDSRPISARFPAKWQLKPLTSSNPGRRRQPASSGSPAARAASRAPDRRRPETEIRTG